MIHDWQVCRDEDCKECTALVENDFLMACDGCDFVGLKEFNACGNVRTGWEIQSDGTVLCEHCASTPSPAPEEG